MSQEKVDRYKKQKANRAKIIKRKKLESFFLKLASSLVVLALVGWIGFSAYKQFYKETTKTHSIDTAAVDDYLNGLNAEESEETESEEETEALTESEETASQAETEETVTEETVTEETVTEETSSEVDTE